MAVQTQISMRRDTAANWTSTNPTLASGEWGLETDTRLMKIGDGSTTWSNLNYFVTPYGHTKMIASSYYFPHWFGNTGATGATLNLMYAAAIVIPNNVTINSLSIEIVAAAGTGGVARLGIYKSDSNNQPSTLVIDGGTVSTTTTGVKELTISQALTPGVYWLSAAFQGNVTGLTYRYIGSNNPFLYSSANFGASSVFNSGYSASASGALPSTFTSTGVNFAPKIWIKT